MGNNGKTKRLDQLWFDAGYESRAAFARAAGVSRQQVWKWTTGRDTLSAPVCKRVADVLGVDMETVLKAVEA